MLKKLLIVIVITCFVATISFAQKKKRTKRESAGDKLITALINAEDVRGFFADDGMYTFTQAPEIQEIFALGKKAIPLLIAHLDDKRLLRIETRFLSMEDDPQYFITIGAASLDLLTYIIRDDARFFDKACIKDMLEGHISSCAKEKYAIFPEDFWSGKKEFRKGIWYGKNLIVKPSVRRAKRSWQTAYRNRWIRYVKFDG